MTLTEQVYAQAALLAGDLDERQTNLLKLLCGASVSLPDGAAAGGIDAGGLQGGFYCRGQSACLGTDERRGGRRSGGGVQGR